jgi:membrane protein YdbS with pleckstrin-like domain
MSSSIEELLAEGEQIQMRTSPSIMDSSFVKNYVIGAALTLGIFGISVMPFELPFNTLYLNVLLVVPLAIIVKSEIERKFIKYFITSQKVIERRGILNQTTESTMYENITDVKLSKDINERIFDVGDLKINTAGHDGATIRLKGLKDPEQYKRTIENNINGAGGASQTGNQQDFGGGGMDSSGDEFGGELDDSGLDGGLDDDDFGL